MSHLRSWWQAHPWRSSLLLLAVAAGLWQLWSNPLQSYWDITNAGALALSPDGRIVAVAGGPREHIKLGPSFGLSTWTSVELRRSSDGQLLQRLAAPAVYSVAFDPAGELLATGGADLVIRVWRVSDGILLQSMPIPWESGKEVRSVRFSPDGRWLAAGSTDGLVRLWRVADGVLLASLTEPGAIYEVAWSPNGQYLAAAVQGGAQRVSIWQLPDRRQVRVIGYPDGQPTTLAFSPDGQSLAVGSQHSNHGEVQLWRVEPAAPTPTRVWRTSVWVFSIALSPDGTRIAAAGVPVGDDGFLHIELLDWLERRTITIWSVDHGWLGEPIQTIQTLQDPLMGLAFSPDGQTLLSSGWEVGAFDNGQVCFWQVAPRAVFWSWGFWAVILLLLVRIWRDHFIWSSP